MPPKKAPKEKEDVVDSNFSDVFSVVEKLNPDACTLSEDSLSNVEDWIDTGNYAMNAIISGSLFGGIAVGRISGFVGPQQTGKSLIMNKILINAQKKGYIPMIWDTESAQDKESFQRLGGDVTKVKYMPVGTIEDCRNQILMFVNAAIEKNLKQKVIICIDSLGNLGTRKDLADAESDKGSTDMGLKAKHMGAMLKSLTFRVAKARIPLIFSNHIYDDPAAMYPSLIKKTSGGRSPLYVASLLVQLSQSNIKVADDIKEASELSGKISGSYLNAFITKNRFNIPYLDTDMYLNFKTGLDQYSGLLALAVKSGIITQTGSTYTMDGKKLGYAKSFELDPKFWDGEVLQKLETVIKKEFKYSDEQTPETPAE